MSEEQDTINNGIAETVPNPFECNICGKAFKNSTGLKIHLNTHNLKKRIKRRTAPIKTTPPDNPREAFSVPEPKANQPWRPASILTTSRLPGMRPRWVRKDLLEKRIEEGWQPRLSDSKSRIESPEKTIVDGMPLSRFVVKRNMVLCDIPEDLAQSREKYYRDINDAGLVARKTELANQTGGQSYGEITVER
jgi:hypothetical protein